MLVLQLLWASQHMGQVELRTSFIKFCGSAEVYLSTRYLINLVWTAAVLILTGLYRADSPIMYTITTRTPSVAVMNVALWVLITLLFILGSPMGTNNKIAHGRHDTDVTGATPIHEAATGREEQALIARAAPAQTSSISKITNNPQLLAIVLFITAMLVHGEVRRIHLFVRIPQLFLIFIGMFLQLRRMGLDSRYDGYLKETRCIPFHALLVGACRWTWQDSMNLLCGSIPSFLILALSQIPPISHALSVFLLPSCLVYGNHDCQVQALALEWVYIVVLVIAAELGARCGYYILPTGNVPVEGTKLFDYAKWIPQLSSSEPTPSTADSAALAPAAATGGVPAQ